MLGTSGSYETIRYIDQNYLPGKINLQVSVLMIKYLIAAFLNYGWCNICYLFGFNYCFAEIEIKKSGMDVW